MRGLVDFLFDTLCVLFVLFLIGLLITISVLGLRMVIKHIREEKGEQE